jgi:hypothetical protein
MGNGSTADHLRQWGSLVAVGAGSVWLAEEVAIRLSSDSDAWDCNSRWDYGINTLDPIAFGLAALAVVAVHQRQRARSGRLGTVGAGAAALGLLAGGINNPIEHCGDISALGTILWAPAALLMTFGQVLLGVAMIRSRVLPTWAGAILLVGTLSWLVLAERAGMIGFSLAWIAVGIALQTSLQPDK